MANNAKIALLCAYTLASARRYAEAEALLLSDGELAKTTEALDLLARVRAEQGDVAEARRLWQEIQSLHPEHVPSRLALRNLGKPPRAVPWRALCCLLAPLALMAGLLVGVAVAPRPAPPVTMAWPAVPTGRQLEALAPYRGRVARVCLASAFFSDPARTAQRAVLAQLLSDALGVAPGDVFLAGAAVGQPADTLHVELTLR